MQKRIWATILVIVLICSSLTGCFGPKSVFDEVRATVKLLDKPHVFEVDIQTPSGLFSISGSSGGQGETSVPDFSASLLWNGTKIVDGGSAQDTVFLNLQKLLISTSPKLATEQETEDNVPINWEETVSAPYIAASGSARKNITRWLSVLNLDGFGEMKEKDEQPALFSVFPEGRLTVSSGQRLLESFLDTVETSLHENQQNMFIRDGSSSIAEDGAKEIIAALLSSIESCDWIQKWNKGNADDFRMGLEWKQHFTSESSAYCSAVEACIREIKNTLTVESASSLTVSIENEGTCRTIIAALPGYSIRWSLTTVDAPEIAVPPENEILPYGETTSWLDYLYQVHLPWAEAPATVVSVPATDVIGSSLTSPVPIKQWTTAGKTYDGATGVVPVRISEAVFGEAGYQACKKVMRNAVDLCLKEDGWAWDKLVVQVDTTSFLSERETMISPSVTVQFPGFDEYRYIPDTTSGSPGIGSFEIALRRPADITDYIVVLGDTPDKQAYIRITGG